MSDFPCCETAITIEGKPSDIRPGDRLIMVDGMALNPNTPSPGLLVEHISSEFILGSDIGVRNVTVWGRTDMIDLRLTHDLVIKVRREAG